MAAPSERIRVVRRLGPRRRIRRVVGGERIVEAGLAGERILRRALGRQRIVARRPLIRRFRFVRLCIRGGDRRRVVRRLAIRFLRRNGRNRGGIVAPLRLGRGGLRRALLERAENGIGGEREGLAQSFPNLIGLRHAPGGVARRLRAIPALGSWRRPGIRRSCRRGRFRPATGGRQVDGSGPAGRAGARRLDRAGPSGWSGCPRGDRLDRPRPPARPLSRIRGVTPPAVARRGPLRLTGVRRLARHRGASVRDAGGDEALDGIRSRPVACDLLLARDRVAELRMRCNRLEPEVASVDLREIDGLGGRRRRWSTRHHRRVGLDLLELLPCGRLRRRDGRRDIRGRARGSCTGWRC